MRGDWHSAPESSWSQCSIPAPPPDLLRASVDAWRTWFGAWFAAQWIDADVPALRVLITLYDRVQRGEYARASELRLWMDGFGITHKGQQDRRWVRLKVDEQPEAPEGPISDPYATLRAVR
jgi:hypothetical protein